LLLHALQGLRRRQFKPMDFDISPLCERGSHSKYNLEALHYFFEIFEVLVLPRGSSLRRVSAALVVNSIITWWALKKDHDLARIIYRRIFPVLREVIIRNCTSWSLRQHEMLAVGVKNSSAFVVANC